MSENLLFYGDNLDVLRGHKREIPDGSVDLVYADPPFNSNRAFNVFFGHGSDQKAAQRKAFDDTWSWDQSAAASYDEVLQHGGEIAELMRAFRLFLGNTDMMAYLAMMAPRLIELRRILKENGSIYLHCDPTASHYLKLLLDGVFGPKAFRNEIIWHRTPFAGSSKARAHQYPRSHDVILFYTKGDTWTWNTPAMPYSEKYLARFKWDDNDGRGPYRKTLLKTFSEATFQRLQEEGRLIEPQKAGAMYSYKQYLNESSGITQIDDVWIDINALNPVAKERLGYPTQKPQALLERIIQASSNPGDTILDPFCGCGTTIAAAQALGRPWIGIDITHLAINLIRHRLKDSYGGAAKFKVIGEPVDRAGAEALAKDDPWQFQWWMLGLVGARPAEEKKGADHGIDGRLYFHDKPGGPTRSIVLSVKAGQNVGVAAVRDLRAVREREQAEIGVLLMMRMPTAPMRAEAADAGFFESPWGKHPRIQILTVDDLFDGKGIDYPNVAGANVTFKRAPKAQPTAVAQALDLDLE